MKAGGRACGVGLGGEEARADRKFYIKGSKSESVQSEFSWKDVVFLL